MVAFFLTVSFVDLDQGFDLIIFKSILTIFLATFIFWGSLGSFKNWLQLKIACPNHWNTLYWCDPRVPFSKNVTRVCNRVWDTCCKKKFVWLSFFAGLFVTFKNTIPRLICFVFSEVRAVAKIGLSLKNQLYLKVKLILIHNARLNVGNIILAHSTCRSGMSNSNPMTFQYRKLSAGLFVFLYNKA